MKKFFTAATAAAITASMLCAPAAIVVSAAETAAFDLCVNDAVITEGTKDVQIPVSFNKNVTFKTMEIEFSCTGFKNVPAVKCAISDIVSAFPENSGVTVAVTGTKVVLTSSSDTGYTIKKNDKFLNINFEITELIKAGSDEKWPVNSYSQINVKSFNMTNGAGETVVLDSTRLVKAGGIVQVIPEQKTSGCEISIESVMAEESKIKVPVKFKGSANVLVTEIRVSDGAEIVDFEETGVFKQCMKNEREPGRIKLLLENGDIDSKDIICNNDIIGYVVINLKDANEELCKSDLSIVFVDVSTENGDSHYPSLVKNGMAVKGLRGDVNFDGQIDVRDATNNVQDYNSKKAGENTYLADLYSKDLAMQPLVEAFGAEKLAEYALKFGDVNKDGENDTRDASFQIQYYNALRAADDPSTVTWDTIVK